MSRSRATPIRDGLIGDVVLFLPLGLRFLAAEYGAVGRVINGLAVELADEFGGW